MAGPIAWSDLGATLRGYSCPGLVGSSKRRTRTAVEFAFGSVRTGTTRTRRCARSLMNQLEWAPEISSGHPAMQELNPRVNELLLQYDRTPVNALEPTRH